MHDQNTGKLTCRYVFFTVNSVQTKTEALGGAPGHVEPSSDSCYFQWYLPETCLWAGRGLFASLWCLPTHIDIDVNSNWRSWKIWVLHKDLMLFIACTAIFPLPLLLLGWSKLVEMKSRSPFTGTPIPSGKAHEVERERFSCKNHVQNAFRHL